MAQFIEQNFVPVRQHVKSPDYARSSERFAAFWTPTVLVIDPEGVERHRIEGFLPPDDFLDQLTLGLAHGHFQHREWHEAERLFREVTERHPEGDGAAEATYWAGVSHYKATGDAAALRHTAEEFAQHHQDTPWATKASVWGQPHA